MNCCAPCVMHADTVEPDPCKHVNYELGMLLGKADFEQEFAYLAGRDRALAREALGYGTLRGLGVSLDEDTTGPRVRIAAGVALTPGGQLVCVDAEQCASLNPWLAKQRDEIGRRLGSPNGVGSPPEEHLDVFVTLTYRARLTDPMPVPGEPCRTEAELTAPSRVTDDFCLSLSFDRPEQREEEAVRRFAALLRDARRIDASPPPTLAEFLQGLRDADPLATSPPTLLEIPSQECDEYLREALKLWVIELRQKWMLRIGCCRGADNPSEPDPGVLVARLDVPILADGRGAWVVSDTQPVVIDESTRPWLLTLRMLQALIDPCCCGEGGEGQLPGNSVSAETTFGLAPFAGRQLEYARADHTHGTPTLPVIAGDVTGAIGASTVERLRGVTVAATVPSANQVLAFSGGAWRPASLPAVSLPNLAGDVTGSPITNTVVQLQGVPIAATGPNANQVLTFVAGQWTPQNLPAPSLPALAGDVTGAIGATQVVRLQQIPVAANPPVAGQVLGFDGAAWRPTAAQTGGQFVGRGALARFDIVAAGIVQFEFDGTPANSVIKQPVNAYNGLSEGPDPDDALVMTGTRRLGIMLTFKGMRRVQNLAQAKYIVKLTPWVNRSDEGYDRFLAYFGGYSKRSAAFAVFIDRPKDVLLKGAFMVEVSEFE